MWRWFKWPSHSRPIKSICLVCVVECDLNSYACWLMNSHRWLSSMTQAGQSEKSLLKPLNWIINQGTFMVSQKTFIEHPREAPCPPFYWTTVDSFDQWLFSFRCWIKIQAVLELRPPKHLIIHLNYFCVDWAWATFFNWLTTGCFCPRWGLNCYPCPIQHPQQNKARLSAHRLSESVSVGLLQLAGTFLRLNSRRRKQKAAESMTAWAACVRTREERRPAGLASDTQRFQMSCHKQGPCSWGNPTIITSTLKQKHFSAATCVHFC